MNPHCTEITGTSKHDPALSMPFYFPFFSDVHFAVTSPESQKVFKVSALHKKSRILKQIAID